MARLNAAHPGRFSDVQLQTLQCRVKDRHGVTGKKLVYSAPDEPVLQLSDRGEPV